MDYKILLGTIVIVLLLSLSMVQAQDGEINDQSSSDQEGGFVDGGQSPEASVEPTQTQQQMRQIRVYFDGISDMSHTQKEELYREKFGISAGVDVRPTSVEQFAAEADQDPDAVDTAATVTRIVPVPSREPIASNLLKMDKGFVKRLADKSAVDESFRENVQIQMETYKQDLENRDQIRITFNRENVKQLFQKRISLSQFISQIWPF